MENLVNASNPLLACLLSLLPFSLRSPVSGGECVWGRGRGGPAGRLDGAVRRGGVGARGGGPAQTHCHRRPALSDRRAVRPAHQRAAGGPRHASGQPAQLLESHGGDLHEAQLATAEDEQCTAAQRAVIDLVKTLTRPICTAGRGGQPCSPLQQN